MRHGDHFHVRYQADALPMMLHTELSDCEGAEFYTTVELPAAPSGALLN